ncbi:MAG: peptidoglycan-binding protein [Clostridia bacterium]|nr:peptidoglycan-binding protein [Clostridia bacterium]
MKKYMKLGLAASLTAFAILLSGCNPGTDTTDPLSDYSVNVNVPFPTLSTAYSTVSPGGARQTVSPTQRVTVMGWMNEALDKAVIDQYQELSLGSLGTNVRNLQKRLIELGYLDGTASGTFDQATAQAVRLFESAYGRVQTGTASQLLQVYLFSNSAKAYSGRISAQATDANTGYTKLERGSTGAAVARLQNRLIELGYLSGSATGIFDANTENAIKEFEAIYGKQRTGIATVALQEYLFSNNAYYAGAVTPTPTPYYAPTPAPTRDTSGGYTPLQYGSKGDAVTALQTRLRFLGYYTGKVDGIYGNGTVNAVKKFEAAYGKPQTGIATAAMQVYLYRDDALTYQEAVTPTPTAVLYQTLYEGSYGEEVVKLQKRLIQLGYLKGSADGYYGENTANAVRAFEARYGKVQTGVATPDMQKYLFAGDALKNTSSAPQQTEYMALGEGSYGTAVYALENRLIELNYMDGAADGYYDSETTQAIKTFEYVNGRTQTGVASVSLQELLYSKNAKSNSRPGGSTGYKKLKNGDKNDEVAKLQRRLIELNYLTGTVDGYFGDGTEAAVRAFQAVLNLTQDGVANDLVQTYLYAGSAPYNPNGEVAVSYATLESGDSGEGVKALQNRLIQLGYLSGKADGKFGSGTKEAVKAFQKAVGLKANGVANAQTQKELYAETAPRKGEAYEKEVVVNKGAIVTSPSTVVYDSISKNNVLGTLYSGTEITILSTAGQWAQIKNSAGAIGYAYLSDFSIIDDDPAEQIEVVNKQAVITQDQVSVYRTASESSGVMGKLSTGAKVKWLRTNGDWAEVQNSVGEIGYMYKKYLSVDLDAFYETQSAYEPLSTGMTGERVKTLQRRLQALGYFDGSIGGNYLTKTTSAVKAFQAAIGMEQTGEATSALQEIMFSAYAPYMGEYANTLATTYQTLSFGSADESVGELQLRLINLGYLDSTAITYGSFDENTRDAIVDLQTELGFTNPDGVASIELQAYIASDASEKIAR